MKWVTSSEIKTWAESKARHCQETLPELVRRLILAHTINSIDEFDFPSGDSVSGGGWDGRLSTPVVSPFFPTDFSVWEIGSDKSANKKADADYEKRTSNPLGVTQSETTFVFVTPRSWPSRVTWQQEKNSTKVWKDVRVINCDNLEQWLDSTPAVALWLARQIGKVVSDGIRDLESVWEEWSVGTKPAMTPALVIGGRVKDTEKIQAWIMADPGILEVQGDHPDETLAFLYSSISKLPETEKIQALSRCIVVENINEMRQVTQAFQNYPLIIAAPGECLKAAHSAVAKGHHVYISMDSTVIGVRDILRLSRPQRDVVEKVLNEQGLTSSEADRIARDSGRSIPVLRRHLFQSNIVSAPSWADAASANTLLPGLFVNAWDEKNEGDIEIIEKITGVTYDKFIAKLASFLSIDDSPIRKLGSVWMVKSPLDLWFLVRNHLTLEQLQLYKQSLLSVLTKTNPKYELEAEKRWAAAVYGKSNPFSEWLRTGLIESLVLLSVFDNHSPSSTPTQSFANNVIRDVLEAANKWEFWASVSDATPLLAEAAPNEFMAVVEKLLNEGPKLFQDLMEDDGSLFGECKHSGLLWALEGLAWSSDYFSRAVNILFNLAEIDQGGRWSNRPLGSLRDIFLPGLPQTHASPSDRLVVLDMLIQKNPKLVWDFIHDYYNSGTISESHRFRWRDTGGLRRGLEPESVENHNEYIEGLQQRFMDLSNVKENVIGAMDDFTRMPLEIRNNILNTLQKTDPSIFSKSEIDSLMHNIRDAYYWISNFGDGERREHLQDLDSIMTHFAPDDVIERLGWVLKTPWPRLPQKKSENYEVEDNLIRKTQDDAAREVLDKESLDNILKFVDSVQYPGVIASSLARVVKNKKEDKEVFDALLGHNDHQSILISSYAQGRIGILGDSWIDNQIKRLKKEHSDSPTIIALLYLGLPEGSVTWSKVSKQGKEVETAYWKQASGYSREDKNEDIPIAVEKLLNAGRPEAALQVAGGKDGVVISSELLQRLLQEFLFSDQKSISLGNMEEYYLGNIFKQLYENNDLSLEDIAKLEWPFAVVFDEIKRYTSSPMAIHRILQEDPKFFSQLITFIYKDDDGRSSAADLDDTDGLSKRKYKASHEILGSWHLIPGLTNKGTVNEQKLRQWIDKARRQCAKIKYLNGCDIQIGFMLAHAPVDSEDGIWPHVAVRNIIESLNNEVIDKHIQTEIFNSRGVVSRNPRDGGKQERKLAQNYKNMGDKLRVKWPRVARILYDMHKTYESEAEREDIDSDLHELRWS